MMKLVFYRISLVFIHTFLKKYRLTSLQKKSNQYNKTKLIKTSKEDYDYIYQTK